MAENIYGAAALDYWEKGWRGVLPLPAGQKWPPPGGRTGNTGEDPSYPDVYAWTEDKARHNIGLRLPGTIVGIDVDAYEGKSGGGAIVEAEARWGALPPTVRSTSRTDSVSGIRLFRVPDGTRLRDRIMFPDSGVGNIEIVQRHHRYVVCWPSVHPSGGVYEWRTEEGEVVDIPSPESLPELPERWITALTVEATSITAVVDAEQVVSALPGGEMSVKVKLLLQKALREMKGSGESRHEATRTNIARLLRMAADNDEPGVYTAIVEMRTAFVEAVEGDRPGAASEFDRMLHGPTIHNMIASTPDASLEKLAGVQPRTTSQIDNPPASTASTAPAPAPAPTPAPPSAPAPSAGNDWLMGDDTPAPAPTMSAADRFLMAGDITLEEYKAARDELAAEDEQVPADRWPVRTISDLAKIPPAVPLIDGLLYQNTLVQITGNPGSYKSFLAVSMACAVASRKELTHWAGYPVKAHGPVIYVAAEGASGLRARILGWCEVHDHEESDVDLLLIDHPVQMGSDEQMQKLINTAVHFGAVMVIFDTRARCTLGIDENKADEQGIAIEAIEQLREATGCTTVVLHHSSRAGSAGRGSSVWDGNVWSDLRVSAKGMTTTIHCEKHKDVTSGCDHEFELSRHSVSSQRMQVDDPFLRNTLVIGETESSHEKNGQTLSTEDLVLKMWSDFASDHSPITKSAYVKLAEQDGCRLSPPTLYRVTNALVNKGLLHQNGEGRGATYRLKKKNTGD